MTTDRSQVHHLLERAALEGPDRPFLVCDDTTASYGEVERGANRFANALIRLGIRSGSRIGLLAQNGQFYVQAYYGILKAGAIAVPINTASDGPSIAALLSGCTADLLVAGDRYGKVAGRAAELIEHPMLLALESGEKAGQAAVSSGILSLDEICAAESAESPGLSLDAEACATILYTSGSTGQPKGATLLHRNILANTNSIVEYLELGSRDRVLAILPFYYVYGLSLLNTHAAVGGTVVVENRFAYPNVAIDTLEDEACTGFAGVPSTFAILLNRSNFAERSLSHLRYVTQAGGAMSPELTRRLMAALPEKQIYVMYGATEASARLSYLSPRDLPKKIGSIGKAIPGVELEIRLPDGREAAVGETGEIIARGESIMSGYWDDSIGTAEVLGEGGYRTGDLARRDEEGFIFIVGRSRDFIKAGAHRISAAEIEQAILEDPTVHEVAAIGVPDEILGEKIRAYVVPREVTAFDATRLLKSLKRTLPPHKLPSEIVIRDDLPKNESGKIMKQQLRDEPEPDGV